MSQALEKNLFSAITSSSHFVGRADGRGSEITARIQSLAPQGKAKKLRRSHVGDRCVEFRVRHTIVTASARPWIRRSQLLSPGFSLVRLAAASSFGTKRRASSLETRLAAPHAAPVFITCNIIHEDPPLRRERAINPSDNERHAIRAQRRFVFSS